MRRILISWIANSLAILAVGWGLGFVTVTSAGYAFAAGALLSVVNAIVRPVLVVLTFPLTIATLGLFYFIITGFCLWLTARIIPGFAVHGVLRTILASILISLVSTVIAWALRGDKRDKGRRT
jgi:putative membrane protein